MKKYILTTIICMISLLSFADNTALYLRLDSVMLVSEKSHLVVFPSSSVLATFNQKTFLILLSNTFYMYFHQIKHKIPQICIVPI